MSEQPMTREGLLQVVRTWIGTPYHHQARLKGVGADCIGELYGPATEYGFPLTDVEGYSRQPYGQKLIAELEQRLDRIPIEEAQPGDVLVFWFETKDYPAHVAWMADGQHGPNMIHTMEKTRRVVEHRINEWWWERVHSAWRLRWPQSPSV